MKKIKFLKPLILLPFLFAACTDLDETYHSQISPDRVPQESRIRGVYTHLKGSMTVNPMTCPFWKLVYAVQTSTDEICIPRQNVNDWQDGGIYQDMQRHTWNANNTIFLSSWNYLYNIISNCNALIDMFGENLSDKDRAELQTLRAYAYYRLMDLFGNVPKLTEENLGQLQMPQNTRRADMFKWVEEQLTYLEGTDILLENCLADRSMATYGTITKGVLNTLKARLYLNSKVFLNLADDSQEYKDYLNKAIVACNAVIGSGQYQLESNVFANWYLDNGPLSREIIWSIPYGAPSDDEGNRLHIETLIPPVAQALGNILGQDESGKDIIGGTMYSNAVSGWHVNPPKKDNINDVDVNAIFDRKHNRYYGIFHENDNRRLAVLSGQLYSRAAYIRGDGFQKLTFDYWDRYDELNPFGTPNATPDAARNRQRIHANLTPWLYNRGFDPAGENNATLNVPKAFGARIIKFELAENPSQYESPVDMIIMRLAELYYTRAEAYIRLGNSGAAKSDLQVVLQHRGFNPTAVPASYTKNYPFLDMDTDIWGNDTEEKISVVALMSKRWLTGNTQDISSVYLSDAIDLELMDKEWRREFIFEDRRRTDMIRMGKFAGPNAVTWGAKSTPTTDATRNLFPIPQSVLNGNPEVKQNPGYPGYDGWLN